MRNGKKSSAETIAETRDVANEIVFGFVAAVGVDLAVAEKSAEKHLKEVGYKVVHIRVTKDVFRDLDPRAKQKFANYYESTRTMMDIGDDARKSQERPNGETKYDVVALGVAKTIQVQRAKNKPGQKTAYLVHSLKHPHEVRTLRNLYQRGFYLIGVHAPAETRREYLTKHRRLSKEKADQLMDRDRQEKEAYGQKLVDTFHLADVFLGLNDGRNSKERRQYMRLVQNNMGRFIEIVFGHPNRTPSFGEYAMFLAFSSSLRSADLSRQVGAVVTRDREILGAGANDCPKATGGLYWPTLNTNTLLFEDEINGRDYTRGKDSNREELIKIKQGVLEGAREAFTDVIHREAEDLIRKELIPQHLAEMLKSKLNHLPAHLTNLLTNKLSHVLEDSPITDLTEYGRVVHAEMEALLSCARKGVSTVGSTLFSTTFPCHNCAKHIIAAGVKRVVFIQPYLKSKALDMYEDDSIEISYATPLGVANKENHKKVRFEPFVGVGPRRFLDLFSMDLGVGAEMKRKDRFAKAKKWSAADAKIRIEMSPDSYFDRESRAATAFAELVNMLKGEVKNTQ